jgi:hypothetical protein
MDDATLYRTAGLSAAIAVPLFLISGVALALFFGGQGAHWGPVNDVFISLTCLALLLPIVAIDRMAADSVSWMRWVSIVAFAGAVIIAVGQLALVVGIIDLNGSYVTGGIGFIGLLVWMIALVVLAFGVGAIPTTIGWLSALTLAFIVLETVVGLATTGVALWVVTAGLVLGMVGWLGSIGAGLLGRASG